MVIFSAQKKSRKFREIIFMKKFREIDKRNTKTMLCSKLLLILQEIKFWDSWSSKSAITTHLEAQKEY